MKSIFRDHSDSELEQAVRAELSWPSQLGVSYLYFTGCRFCRRAPKLDDSMTRCLKSRRPAPREETFAQCWLAVMGADPASMVGARRPWNHRFSLTQPIDKRLGTWRPSAWRPRPECPAACDPLWRAAATRGIPSNLWLILAGLQACRPAAWRPQNARQPLIPCGALWRPVGSWADDLPSCKQLRPAC